MKKILILFPDIHLSYSPTVIGLYDLLAKYFEVSIIAPLPQRFDKQLLLNREIIYLKEFKNGNHRRIYRRLFPLFAFFSRQYQTLTSKLNGKVVIEDAFYEFIQIEKHVKTIEPDLIIAVDFKTLWFAEMLGKDVEFLSLEVDTADDFYQRCSKSNINSVVIQTEDRYNYLFGNQLFKTFLVQNAPVFKPIETKPERAGLVFCGTAWNGFGFYHCLDFIKEFSDYSLTVRGALLDNDREKITNSYQELLLNKQLIIDNKYLEDDEVVGFLQRFRIGFCFYNFELDSINKFNYYSVPSGKMFKYLAAGVPVIAQDIAGMQPIREFDCGVLIKDLKPKSIKAAIDKIEDNFSYYSENCVKAARHYSFDKAITPFIDYLLKL